MSEKLRVTYVKSGDPTTFGGFVAERVPTRFSIRRGLVVRDKTGPYVKHEALLDLRGQLIQEKQAGFELAKELTALRSTTAELMKKIAGLEAENEHQRGRINGLSDAITIMSGTKS